MNTTHSHAQFPCADGKHARCYLLPLLLVFLPVKNTEIGRRAGGLYCPEARVKSTAFVMPTDGESKVGAQLAG